MQKYININENVKRDLVRAFTRSPKEALEQNSNENSFVTANGEALYSWNYTFAAISKAAKDNGLKSIVVPRSKIWGFVAVLSPDEKELVLFFKEQNLRNVLSKFKGKPLHYLSCLLVKNKDLNGQEIVSQTTLFDSFDVDEKKIIDEKREQEAKKMLPEDFEKIQRIFVCHKEEISGSVVSVKMSLLNERGEVVSQEDVTKYMSLDYERASALNNDNDKTSPIPKLKPEFKDQRKLIIKNKKQRGKRENR